ncbi:MAG: DUF167 domain-containing protein [Fimbriimonas sp.]
MIVPASILRVTSIAMDKGCQITVRVTPRSSRNSVELDGEVVRIRVTAPPFDGQANAEVCKILAKALRIAPSYLMIVRGEASREKVIQVQGLSKEEIYLLLS